MNRIEMNRLCKSIVEFVEENPYCTRIDVNQALSKGKNITFAWDSVKHLFDYKVSNGRAPVAYKRNKVEYSREPIVRRPQSKPSQFILEISQKMNEMINNHHGITGAEIRKILSLTEGTFKRASRMLNVDRKRTFGRGTGYWPLGTAPETIRAVRVQSYTPADMRVPTFDGVILTQWRGDSPFTQMSAQ